MPRDGSAVLATHIQDMPAFAHALDTHEVPKVDPVPTFDDVYTAHVGFVWRVLRTFGVPAAQIEDAVQDVFVALVRARRDLAEVGNLRAYLFAALRRACANRAGRRIRGRALPIESVPEPTAAEPPEAGRSDRLGRALLALPPEQREVVALKIDGGLTFAEVAAVLGVSPNTAASRYRYALERLRAALGD